MLLPNPLPGSLSIGVGSQALYVPRGFKYNVAIGGLPFLVYFNREHPMVRETAPVRKQQFDSANIPGEQSLEGWWLRSQQSFHGGSGQLFADPTGSTDTSTLTRFRYSRNVNVWTQGTASLLNAAKKAAGSPIVDVVDATEYTYGDGTHAALAVGGSSLRVVTSAGATTQNFSGVTSASLASVTSDGSYMYVSTSDGVYSAPIPASSATSFTWTKEYAIAGSPSTHVAFVKSRLMLGSGPAVYELTPHPGSPPAALPAAKYTHANSAWVWTGFTESAAAIYAVGNAAGVRGSIVKFVLASDGTVPTLSGAAVAAQLPSGEVPYSVMGYLGSFVGIGTNLGVRVALADSSGNLTYGPLLFETDTPVRAWTARDRFLFCGVTGFIDGDSGVVRIDLSNAVDDLRFAYATDLNYTGDTGTCYAVANLGSSDLTMFATDNDLYVEDSASLALSGYLQTSRVRFSTLEPKLFKLIKTRGQSLGGSLGLEILDDNDSIAGSHIYAAGNTPGDADVSLPLTQSRDFVSVKFTLNRSDTVATDGAAFTGYQLKALPGSPRQRMIQLPLMCFDWEKDARGHRAGGKHTAYGRLTALEELEKSGDSVVLQDFDAGTLVSCVIEQVRFTQTATPPQAQGYGGVVTLTLRTI